tara:strand:+ start:1742 stop:2947 length:1206 start_codon:yes stop_codon:yes gene_type:complete
MILARFLSKLFKKEGIILIDSQGQKYICGEISVKEKPLTLKLLTKDLNLKLLIYPELYLGEEYYKGNIEIENGSIYDFLNLALKNLGRARVNVYSTVINNLFYTFKFLTNHNLVKKSKLNAEMHYNKGEDIYDWMLDNDHRQYSCALFKNPNETLEQAQANKLSHIVKKLNLKPGQRVLDIGCGWGGLSRFIAKEAGCEVHGISLASNQIDYCKKKARELKLDNFLSYELCDYREVKGTWDRIVNVGFFEHVSPKFYKTFFKKIHDLLKDNGDSLCLTHTIASTNPPSAVNPFINKYIFNGGKVPTASQITKALENSGLIISGWESLIDHYNLTLDHWRKRFLNNVDKAKKAYGADFVRLWDFYLSSCSAAFKWSDLLVYQIETVKDFKSVPSRTRDYIYN